jgi:chromosomal replication initiation ATPase DnaA
VRAVLLIDDVRFFPKSHSLDQLFFESVAGVAAQTRSLVLAVHCARRATEAVVTEISSWLDGASVAVIGVPTYQVRRRLLEVEAEARGIDLCAEVLDLLARQTVSDMRVFQGVLNRLAAETQFLGKRSNVQSAEKALLFYTAGR